MLICIRIIWRISLSYSVYVQTLNRKQTHLTLALIPVECFIVMATEDVEMPSIEGRKYPPIHVICEDFSDIWVNVSICHWILSASVAQLDVPSDWRPGGRGFNPRRGRQHSFVEIDHEIFSTVILSLPLIQEGQLSVSGERMCTILVNRLED